MYHAGMSLANRKAAYRMIVYEGVQVIVATIAFSMGIEKPIVRNVIHRGPPRDKDSYYQEIGRLHRLYFSMTDLSTHNQGTGNRENRAEMIHQMPELGN